MEPLTAHIAERLLAAHNRERDAVGVPRLVWSEALAARARVWASYLAKVGHLTHHADAPGDPAPEGENMWAGTRRHYSLEQMFALWAAERSQYRAGRFPDVSRTGVMNDVGHYTQIVWRTTTRVGCAVVEGGEDAYLVCRYAEGGNILGDRPF